MTAPIAGGDNHLKAPAPGAKAALALLLSINLFNYIDRQILSATLAKIKLDATIFKPDDPNLQFKLGLLTTAFLVSYMLLSPLFGWLGDRVHRWTIVGAAVIVWSLASGGTGLAAGYGLLLLTRCLVGVGEAGYGPVAPSMISDLFPVDHRGRVMAWFYMAIPVGSALGFVIGGEIEKNFGWRAAFHAVVIPGLVLGVICFFMRDPPRPHAAKAVGTPAPSYWDVLRELRGIRSFVLCTAGMTASTFVLGGVAALVPLYIFEREARFTLDDAALRRLNDATTSDGQRVVPAGVADKLKGVLNTDRLTTAELRDRIKGTFDKQEFAAYSSSVFDAAPADGSVTNSDITTIFGVILVVSGLLATLLGGVLGDRLRNRGVKGAYFHVAGWGTLLGFPAFLGILYTPFSPFPWAWVCTFLAVFALFLNTGPANTILANVTRSPIRATAFAINILAIHALGDAISPPLMGLVADRSSLQTAFLLTSFLIPVAGVLWIMGAKHLDEDTRRVEG